MTQDYKRHGTTTLFAALDVKSGKVIGDCMPRHRAKEFLKFLRRIDRHVPKSRGVHLVLDNYATHKSPEVTVWLAKHPRFKLHFTPTNGMGERFNGRIEEDLQSHHFRSGEELEATLRRFVWLYNQKKLPQSAPGSKSPLQAMTDWYKIVSAPFKKRPYYLPGCDT